MFFLFYVLVFIEYANNPLKYIVIKKQIYEEYHHNRTKLHITNRRLKGDGKSSLLYRYCKF